MEVPWRRLDGKVVMVTGASSGIGRELCLNLARAGCLVVAAARRTDRLRTLCDEINGSGEEGGPVVRAVAVELDVSGVGSEIEAAVLRAWEAFGRIDALVNNAGYRGGVHSATEWPEEEWHKTISTNLTGLWLVSKYVCRHMRDTKQKGSVINISSISGLDRTQVLGALAYTTSKRGVHGVTRVMAIELGPDNIRVNAIAPGLFKSEITAGLLEKEWLGRVVARTYPLRTYGTTDPALTSLVRYLIHDSSEYVTGNIFTVDAGVSPLVGFGGGVFTVGHAANNAASAKVQKHEQACIDNQHAFIPFAFDTFGFLAPDAVDLLKRVQKVMNGNVMTPGNIEYVFRRIGFAIQKGLAAQLVAPLAFFLM